MHEVSDQHSKIHFFPENLGSLENRHIKSSIAYPNLDSNSNPFRALSSIYRQKFIEIQGEEILSSVGCMITTNIFSKLMMIIIIRPRQIRSNFEIEKTSVPKIYEEELARSNLSHTALATFFVSSSL
jgi:hypothetical protein